MVNKKEYIKAPHKGVVLPRDFLSRIDNIKGELSRNAYIVRMVSHYLNLVEGGHIKPAGNEIHVEQ